SCRTAFCERRRRARRRRRSWWPRTPARRSIPPSHPSCDGACAPRRTREAGLAEPGSPKLPRRWWEHGAKNSLGPRATMRTSLCSGTVGKLSRFLLETLTFRVPPTDRVKLSPEVLVEAIGDDWPTAQVDAAIELLATSEGKFPSGTRKLPVELVR